MRKGGRNVYGLLRTAVRDRQGKPNLSPNEGRTYMYGAKGTRLGRNMMHHISGVCSLALFLCCAVHACCTRVLQVHVPSTEYLRDELNSSVFSLSGEGAENKLVGRAVISCDPRSSDVGVTHCSVHVSACMCQQPLVKKDFGSSR